jgi:hypothetical protein
MGQLMHCIPFLKMFANCEMRFLKRRRFRLCLDTIGQAAATFGRFDQRFSDAPRFQALRGHLVDDLHKAVDLEAVETEASHYDKCKKLLHGGRLPD